MDDFYCCYVEDAGGCTNKHYTLEEAEAEAERLAVLGKNVGKKVYILHTIKYCQTVEPVVRWSDMPLQYGRFKHIGVNLSTGEKQ